MAEEEWQTWHNYNRLVRRGLVTPMTCDCGTELTLRIDELDCPIFECFGCGTVTYFGMVTYGRVKAIVREYFK